MTPDAVRDLLQGRPFRPFRVVMADGRAFVVPRPDRAFVTLADLLVGVGDLADEVPDDARILSWPQVAALEPLDFDDPG